MYITIKNIYLMKKYAILTTIITLIFNINAYSQLEPCDCDLAGGPIATYSGNSAISMPPLVVGHVVIDGDFEIVDATTFDDACVTIINGGAIIIPASNTLIVKSSLLSSDGMSMWQGVVVEVGGTYTQEASTVCLAKVGVDSKGTGGSVGDFTITKSCFIRNQIGVRAKNYNGIGDHPSSIASTEILGGLLVGASTLRSVIGL
ncbi:MAG: hypothetical protein ACI959_002254 [Limisphaerales bacterium]